MGIFDALFNRNQKKEDDNNQKNFEVLKFDGMRAAKMGQVDYAISCYEKALEIESDFETMGYLADIYTKKGEYDKAHALYEKMIHQEPQYVEPYLYLAKLCYLKDDYKEMAKMAKKAIEIEDGNEVAHYLLGKAENADGDVLMSIGHLTTSISIKDDFTEARVLRAEALIKLNQLDDATDDIEAILAQDEENEDGLILQGKVLEAKGKQEEAEHTYQKVINMYPFNEQGYLSLGELYVATQQYDKAIETYNEAIDNNPNFAKAYHERGRVYFLKGENDKATEDMKKAMELSNNEGQEINGVFNNHTATSQNNVFNI